MNLVRYLSASFLVLICFSLSLPKPVDVLIEPKERGKPSRIVSIVRDDRNLQRLMENSINDFTKNYDTILAYDNDSAASYLGGLQAGYHLGVWFQSPSACTLKQIFYYFSIGGDVT
jgi:hypothetical protein